MTKQVINHPPNSATSLGSMYNSDDDAFEDATDDLNRNDELALGRPKYIDEDSVKVDDDEENWIEYFH